MGKKEERRNEVQEKIQEIYVANMTINEVKRRLKEKYDIDIAKETVKKYVDNLVEQGLIEKRVTEEEIREIRRTIIEEIVNNSDKIPPVAKIQEIVQEKLGMSVSLRTIENDKKYLEGQGKIKSFSTRKTEEIQKVREIVKREYNNGEEGKKIHSIVEKEMNIKISMSSVNAHISYWRGKGKLELENENGKKVSKKTKRERREVVNNSKKVDKTQYYKKIVQLYQGFYGQASSLKTFQTYLNNCKQREKEKTIEEDELEAIKCATMATEKYENLAMYIRLCIRFNQFEEALKFARPYQECENFTAEERVKTKKSIKRCEKFCQAIGMILRKK